MVGKTFKGLTDDLLRWQTQRLQDLAIGTEGHVVHVRPKLVVEIALDGVQASTAIRVGSPCASRGYAGTGGQGRRKPTGSRTCRPC